MHNLLQVSNYYSEIYQGLYLLACTPGQNAWRLVSCQYVAFPVLISASWYLKCNNVLNYPYLSKKKKCLKLSTTSCSPTKRLQSSSKPHLCSPLLFLIFELLKVPDRSAILNLEIYRSSCLLFFEVKISYWFYLKGWCVISHAWEVWTLKFAEKPNLILQSQISSL